MNWGSQVEPIIRQCPGRGPWKFIFNTIYCRLNVHFPYHATIQTYLRLIETHAFILIGLVLWGGGRLNRPTNLHDLSTCTQVGSSLVGLYLNNTNIRPINIINASLRFIRRLTRYNVSVRTWVSCAVELASRLELM